MHFLKLLHSLNYGNQSNLVYQVAVMCKSAQIAVPEVVLDWYLGKSTSVAVGVFIMQDRTDSVDRGCK